MSSKSTLTFYFKYTNNNTLPIIDIFANLAGYVKLYLDSKSDNNHQMTKETILDFWDRMAEAKNYSRVDQTHFKKRTHRLLSKKNAKKRGHQLMSAPSFLPNRLPRKVAAKSQCTSSGCSRRYVSCLSLRISCSLLGDGAVIDGELSENRPKCY